MAEHGSGWYENATVYAVDVEAFQDSDGDGVGDFQGLADRLDHLTQLGVDCLWLLPFYPTPNRDNGYDVANYYGVDPRHGTLGDFVEFVRAAEKRDVRVLIDLVVNHTSNEHPWFKRAREDPDSKYRDYYVWSTDPPPADPSRGQVFPGEVDDERVWSFDAEAGAYYHHRFYPFQPDLDLTNPDVREEIRKIMGFWLRLGVSGFRVDAAGLMVQEKRPGMPAPEDPTDLLRTLRSAAAAYREDAVLLGEADVPTEELPSFAGPEKLNLLLNFVLNAALYHSLAAESGDPIRELLAGLPDLPDGGDWVNFLRNYDELNIGSLDDAAKETVFEAFAPDPSMRIYGRGIRRRLAPMLDGDRRRIELAYSLLFSLPGAPMLVYGDEIGMGEDLSLAGRTAVRTPMQWSDDENAGFSTADPEDLVRPVVSDGPFAYDRVNVADQRADDDSLLAFFERLIEARNDAPGIGVGDFAVADVDATNVFAHRCEGGEASVAAVHNLADDPTTVAVDPGAAGPVRAILGDGGRRRNDGRYEFDLDGYDYRWIRAERESGYE
ncbi:trehalose synthase [Halostella sp. JP-L12]|uniref:alpha-amylase family protein n=1 Tax=Halostella TaxID=1843185 RepID=UPI000EF7A8AD|nr:MULTISPECIES: alpha-amylase family protein [Halostella]NHN48560.1 trehalose synthase [Halostella sp. JP-L12]